METSCDPSVVGAAGGGQPARARGIRAPYRLSGRLRGVAAARDECGQRKYRERPTGECAPAGKLPEQETKAEATEQSRDSVSW